MNDKEIPPVGRARRTWHVRFEWKPEDLWVGAFWRHTNVSTDDGPKRLATDVWVCLLPCVPLHLTVWHPVAIPFDDANSRRIGGD